jgi:hypothetical protein
MVLTKRPLLEVEEHFKKEFKKLSLKEIQIDNSLPMTRY